MREPSTNPLYRALWLGLGLVCVALGTIGIFLPLLPTTIFLIIAAYAFARSSERLHNWLLSNKIFGPLINDWQDHGRIRRPAKVMALISMTIIIGLSWAFGVPIYVLGIQCLILIPVAGFIATRPE